MRTERKKERKKMKNQITLSELERRKAKINLVNRSLLMGVDIRTAILLTSVNFRIRLTLVVF